MIQLNLGDLAMYDRNSVLATSPADNDCTGLKKISGVMSPLLSLRLGNCLDFASVDVRSTFQ